MARRAFTGGPLRPGRFLSALRCARVDTGEFDAAEASLSKSYVILSEVQGATDRDRKGVLSCLVKLYEARHAAEPDRSYGTKASEWRARLKRAPSVP